MLQVNVVAVLGTSTQTSTFVVHYKNAAKNCGYISFNHKRLRTAPPRDGCDRLLPSCGKTTCSKALTQAVHCAACRAAQWPAYRLVAMSGKAACHLYFAAVKCSFEYFWVPGTLRARLIGRGAAQWSATERLSHSFRASMLTRPLHPNSYLPLLVEISEIDVRSRSTPQTSSQARF